MQEQVQEVIPGHPVYDLLSLGIVTPRLHLLLEKSGNDGSEQGRKKGFKRSHLAKVEF